MQRSLQVEDVSWPFTTTLLTAYSKCRAKGTDFEP
jgi:hypothetical protein